MREQEGSQTFTAAELENWTNPRAITAGISRIKFDVERLKLFQPPRKLPAHLFKILVQYVTLKLYREFHWRSDLKSVRIGKLAGHNHFDKKRFYLSKFKTSKHFAKKGLLPMVFTPSEGLERVIKKYLAVREKQDFDNDYFIVNMRGKPFTSSTFNQFLTSTTFKYVGKKLGSSQLRKIYVTAHLKGNPSLREKRAMARSMMQLSLVTHESYARLYTEDED